MDIVPYGVNLFFKMALQINIITPGKHSKEIQPLLEKYQKQIGRFAQVNWILTPTGTNSQELNSIRDRVIKTDYIVCDERGELVTTDKIASFLEQKMIASKDPMNLIIGGSYGLDEEIRSHAKAIWSFGKITLPHQLVRVILFEQLYRAGTILQNHPYHHVN